MYVLFSGILLAWELVGVDLPKEPFTAVKVTLKSPEAAPFVLLALIGYFGFHSTVEWYQCDAQRRAQIPSLIDFGTAHLIATCAVLVYAVQALARVQLVTYVNANRTAQLLVGFFAVFGIHRTIVVVRFWKANLFIRGQIVFAGLALAALATFSWLALPLDQSWWWWLIAGTVVGLGFSWLVNLVSRKVMDVFLEALKTSKPDEMWMRLGEDLVAQVKPWPDRRTHRPDDVPKTSVSETATE
jgi:hypothetical protein